MRSIRSKIMWLLFGCVLVSSLLIGLLSMLFTAGIIEKSANENMKLLCKTKADEVDILFGKLEDSVDTLAHYADSELVDAEMLKEGSYREDFTASLKERALHHIETVDGAMAVYVYYDASFVGCDDGFFYAKKGSDGEFTEQPFTDISAYTKEDDEHVGWWYIPTERKAATWLEAYYNANLDHDIISYIVPIYKDDQLLGVIGADISADRVAELGQSISIYQSGKAAVLNSDGTVVYHPSFARYTRLEEEDPGFAGVVEKLSEEKQTDVLIPYQLNGVNKRLAGCKLCNGMLMVCYAPVSEIYREQNKLVLFTTVTTLLVLAGTWLAAFLVSRKLARPIKKLNEAAKHLTDGEFDFHIRTDSHDEIGELTTTFIETRKVLRQQLRLLDAEAHRDGLTGVGNHSAFLDREKEINREISQDCADFAVAVFDVNKLKITNDVFGHMAGDKLLSTTAEHLASAFSRSDVYRTGGDEFVVIIAGRESVESEALVKACVDGMKMLEVEGYPDSRVSCAWGVSRFDPQCDHQFSDVLHRADKEMYKNKAISKKEVFSWQKGEKGIKQLQVEKYCQLLQTLTGSTDDYLFLMNTETGMIRFFGDDPNTFNIADGRFLTNGIEDMLAYVHTNDRDLVAETVLTVVDHDMESVDINFRMRDDSNHNMRWVNCRGSVIKDETDSHFVVIGRISQNAVKHLYNPVTTLFNKAKLKLDFENNATGKFNYLMLLDIDNLSEINLKHGSVYGDKLLRSLAEELERRFQMWQIYHAEKDRFVVLLDITSGKEVDRIFGELKTAMADKCSISAAAVPNERSLYISGENIYDCAAQMLVNSKKNGFGKVAFFSKESVLEKISTVELLEELEESVKHKCRGFYLEYQPQVSAEDYSVISAEALLRFTSETKGTVYPDQFVPVLEQTGLINDVGIWVVDEALRQCKRWRSLLPDFRISVNISPRQLEKKRVAAQIKRLLTKHELPGDCLILEITESAQLDENEEIFAVLAKFRQAGIQIAIDDFGTGYSNLGNLKHIHANILKVDRVFIRDIKENGYNYNLIHNVIEFARANSLKVCLEGVETPEELAVLSGLYPDTFQGYLFDKPCPVQVIEARYFSPDSQEYAERANQIEHLQKERKHSPVANMEMKTILRSICVGLWIIRVNVQSGIGELYADDTMRFLLGVDAAVTPKACYEHWWNRIDEAYRPAVTSMIEEMRSTDGVVQVEYPWGHPQKGEIMVRCTGRCVEKGSGTVAFEGFHRIISDVGTSF